MQLNKGVISTILPDDQMPVLSDGRNVEVIFNALGVINRLNSAQLFEISVNFMSDRIIEHMQNELHTLEEREALLFDYIGYFNERGEKDQLESYYYGLSIPEREEFFESMYETGIYINIPPISTSEKPLFDIIAEIQEKYPWIKPYDCFIKKWGRTIKMMNQLIVGEEYIIKLKQTAKKNFSVRSTGYLSQKGLPDKSNKSKHNQQLYSTTPIKIGRDENNNLAIGIDSRTLAKFHLFYRSSPAARREVGKLYTKNCLNFPGFKTKKRFKNRNVEILAAYFKSEGYMLDYGFNGLAIDCYDTGKESYMFRNQLYIASHDEMREELLQQKWTKEFNKVLHVGSDEEVSEWYERFVDKERAKLEGQLYVGPDEYDF